VVDLDRCAADGVGQPQAPDVLAGAVVEGDRKAGVDVPDVADRGAGADGPTEPDPVAVIGVRLGNPGDGRAGELVGLIAGEGV